MKERLCGQVARVAYLKSLNLKWRAVGWLSAPDHGVFLREFAISYRGL